MFENVSKKVMETVTNFRKLEDTKKLYIISIILSHIENGLINDGQFLDVDSAYENDKLVLVPEDVGLSETLLLATKILLIAANKEGITINANGIDIEPYVKDKKSISPILSNFYKLNFCDKIHFIPEVLYEVSQIKDTKILDYDFNELIDNFLTYIKYTFGTSKTNFLIID